MSQRVTMSDVAREAGVSLMTVSRVINNKGEISPDTRRRVQEVVEKLGYRPSGIARSLATRRTYTIGLIVPDIANPYFSGMAHGAAKIAYSEGFSVLLCDCEENPELELEMLNVLEEKRVDGVIVASPRSTTNKLIPVLSRHSNVVIVNRIIDESSDPRELAHVINDDKEGGYLVTKFLLDHGHVVVGFLAGPKISYGYLQRDLGYRSALKEHNLDYRPEIVQHCPPTVEGGRKAAIQLLQDHPEIDALVCFNDLVAIGALQCCYKLGIKVSEDLAIIGYDDIPMASWVRPSLTTCRVNFEEMGGFASQLLVQRIRGCAEDCKNIVLEPELVLRYSAP